MKDHPDKVIIKGKRVKRTCKNCVWYIGIKVKCEFDDPVYGECRLKPTFVGGGGDPSYGVAVFPLVGENKWCSHHRHKGDK